MKSLKRFYEAFDRREISILEQLAVQAGFTEKVPVQELPGYSEKMEEIGVMQTIPKIMGIGISAGPGYRDGTDYCKAYQKGFVRTNPLNQFVALGVVEEDYEVERWSGNLTISPREIPHIFLYSGKRNLRKKFLDELCTIGEESFPTRSHAPAEVQHPTWWFMKGYFFGLPVACAEVVFLLNAEVYSKDNILGVTLGSCILTGLISVYSHQRRYNKHAIKRLAKIANLH